MKRLLFILMSVLLLPGLPLFGGENILVNGDFETGTIEGWGARFGIGSIEATTDNPYNGDYCGRDFNRTATWHGIWQSQNMRDVTELGQAYTVQVWLRTDQETPVNVAVTMQYEPTSGTVYNQITNADVGTEWTFIEAEYTMLDNDSTTATFYIEAPGSADCEIFVDDAYMGIGPPEPAFRGQAMNPVPEDGDDQVDSEITTEISWSFSDDPNIASITGYDVVFGSEPNMLLNPVYNVATESLPVTLDYDTTYYWRVDTDLVWDSNDISETGSLNETVTGFEWTFTTLPFDTTPVVTADDVLTSINLLPALLSGTVDDNEEGDIASVAWDVTADVPAAAMQMITRGGAAQLDNLAELTADPNLLMDWIGTDTREGDNPLFLTLKGLPADTYSWKSYHHDAQDQSGTFDVTVIDTNGSVTTTDIQISDANNAPVTTFETTLESNGNDDVILVFDQQDYDGVVALAFFLMNGFELTGTGDSLYVDFGNTVSATDANGVNVMSGYEAYAARHEVPASFNEQSYNAFSTTVSVLPFWGGLATVEDTTESLLSPTAELTTDWPASYLVQLTATDGIGQTGSDTFTVTVTADNCAAAQLSTAWDGFNVADYNEDCVVDIEDIALFATEWLDDRTLPGQE